MLHATLPRRAHNGNGNAASMPLRRQEATACRQHAFFFCLSCLPPSVHTTEHAFLFSHLFHALPLAAFVFAWIPLFCRLFYFAMLLRFCRRLLLLSVYAQRFVDMSMLPHVARRRMLLMLPPAAACCFHYRYTLMMLRCAMALMLLLPPPRHCRHVATLLRGYDAMPLFRRYQYVIAEHAQFHHYVIADDMLLLFAAAISPLFFDAVPFSRAMLRFRVTTIFRAPCDAATMLDAAAAAITLACHAAAATLLLYALTLLRHTPTSCRLPSCHFAMPYAFCRHPITPCWLTLICHATLIAFADTLLSMFAIATLC